MKRAGALRIAFAALVVAGASAAGLDACNLFDSKYPPLPNEDPNRGVIAHQGGTGGTSGAGGGGPVDNCECVAAFCMGATSPCAQCFVDVLSGSQCQAQSDACTNDADAGAESCSDVTKCVSNACGTSLAAEQTCFLPADQSQGRSDYNALLDCVCAACGAKCADPGVACGGTGGSTSSSTLLTTP
ncbi:MAG TPA: hypothetical protein VHB21_02860 [Minicystis sp.]|nr:hypothetical protein [Minicystis sp.]